MEFFLRLLQFTFKIIYALLYPILQWLIPRKGPSTIPPIRNRLVTLPLVDVILLMKGRKLKSVDLVKAYIERIKEVEPHINAVVEDRFAGALEDAIRADELIAKTPDEQLPELFGRYMFLGVPFTVKECCGVKGMPIRVGSRQRAHLKSPEHGDVVRNLIDAGAIPLLVSITAEYCFGIETNPMTQKRCLNPHDSRRTPGGSSGGEGALNGAGASLFGVGSDIAGSIRIPSLFNGVFGHKPTGGLNSIVGHFPACNDRNCRQYLQLGPITRYGRDLSLIMQVMAGKNLDKMNLTSPISTRSIKIYYAFGFDGLNGFLRSSPVAETKLAIMKALKHFDSHSCIIERVSMKAFKNSLEMSLSSLVLLEGFPYLINTPNPNKVLEHFIEYAKALFGRSEYSKEAIFFDIMRRLNGFMNPQKLAKYKAELETLKAEFSEMLGEDGVLFFPTFSVPAVHHHTSPLALWNVDCTMIFNAIGFPATHIPMGRDGNGLPIGFQVIAAPYRDILCFHIAGELERAFGGWIIPSPHDLQRLEN